MMAAPKFGIHLNIATPKVRYTVLENFPPLLLAILTVSSFVMQGYEPDAEISKICQRFTEEVSYMVCVDQNGSFLPSPSRPLMCQLSQIIG